MAYGNHANCKHLEKVYEPDRNNTTQRQRLVNNAILLESSTTADFSVFFFIFIFFSSETLYCLRDISQHFSTSYIHFNVAKNGYQNVNNDNLICPVKWRKMEELRLIHQSSASNNIFIKVCFFKWRATKYRNKKKFDAKLTFWKYFKYLMSYLIDYFFNSFFFD